MTVGDSHSLSDKGSIAHEEQIVISSNSPSSSLEKGGCQKSLDALGGDKAAQILASQQEHVFLTPEDDRRILRLIDRGVLPVMLLVYFLQQLDKSSVSYTSAFDIVGEIGLVGTQYSWLTSIVYVAQLVFQPLTAYALVRIPVAKWVFFNVLAWGITVAASSAARSFAGLISARLFLGIFEASVAPAFITITQMWWRRREQTYRTASWNAANGVCAIFGSLLAFGVGHINNNHIRPYQGIFLFCGCITLVCTPLIWFFLPDSPTSAKFLKGRDQVLALERLRDNNMGTESKVWKWPQFWETFRDLKTYLWFALLFLAALPSGGIGAFGPLIIQGFGFNSFQSILFNMPFGVLSIVSIFGGAWLTNKIRLRFPVIILLCCFPIAGSITLLKLGRGEEDKGALLAAYYIVSVMGGIQPMLYAWAPLNACGHTKKVTTTSVFFIAQCVGNIVGPLLYKTEMKPRYTQGLIADLACWCALAILSALTALYLHYLNILQAKKRVKVGKESKIVDTSILTIEDAAREREARGEGDAEGGTGKRKRNEKAFDDLTDFQNEDFVYVL